jgi:hypothetical protein
MTNPNQSRVPRRSPGRIVAVICISLVVLCGVALLPSPARTIAVAMVIPLAAAFLPIIFFSAAKLRCPACQKALPLGYDKEECPSCAAPLDLKPSRPSTRT